ncbi:MAG TPA: hypothetical protein VEX41_04405 [Candidatus Eisenbacteria bacterium]|nr:hypothetical protein [Candidatus Eisenbacteria bacterium]
MTRIYLDPEAATIEGGGDRSPGGGDTSPDAGAVRALRYLVDAGHDVIVVAAAGQQLPSDLLEVAREAVTEVPEMHDVPAWYLTRDVERCTGLSARVRTVLIGAAPPSGSVRRCDTVARDVQAAVMEILAAEAMP